MIIWNQKETKWEVLCRKSTVEICEDCGDGDKQWLTVKDKKTDNTIFNHVIPNNLGKDKGDFKISDEKLNCQWFANDDRVQKTPSFNVGIYFKAKSEYQTFIDSFKSASYQNSM